MLATKVYGPMGDGVNDRGLSAYHIRKACEDSLRRLQTDHIDLYQMHHVERSTPWEEIWQAMEQLVREGKVLYVGSSNFAGLHIALAQFAAEKRNFLGLVSEQSLYNLRDRMIELEVIPACETFGLGLIPWSPLAGGLLGGALQEGGRGAPVVGAHSGARSRSTGRNWKRTKRCAASWARRRPMWRWRGCCTSRRSRRRSSARAPWPVRGEPARAGDRPGCGRAGASGRDLAGAGRRRAGSVRVVRRRMRQMSRRARASTRTAIIGTRTALRLSVRADRAGDAGADTELVAVWGRSEDSARRLGESLGVPWYTDLDRLMRETAPEIGIVSVNYGPTARSG